MPRFSVTENTEAARDVCARLSACIGPLSEAVLALRDMGDDEYESHVASVREEIRVTIASVTARHG